MRPWRDSRYLRWIRTFPCAVCGSSRYIEAAHTGPHGLGQKSADSTAIPLCITHHRNGKDSYHKLGPRAFAEAHNLNISELVTKLSARPTIKVISGQFIGGMGDELHVLGPVEAGIVFAVRRAIVLKRNAVLDSEVFAARHESPTFAN